MKTLKVIVEKTKDFYTAYADEAVGINGGGNTIEEMKKNLFEGLELYKEVTPKKEWPDAIKTNDFEIIYKYDTQSFLNYYSRVFTKSALERMTGINQQLLHHYAKGLKKPREVQRKKIEKAIHDLAHEMLHVQL